MISVIYTSRAATAFDERELGVLLSLSQSNNDRDGLSGRLLHVYSFDDPDNAWFAQVLEGESEPIDRLLERISEDELHQDVTVLAQKQITTRSFPGWTMQLSVLSESQTLAITGAGDLASCMQSLAAVETLLYGAPPNDA